MSLYYGFRIWKFFFVTITVKCILIKKIILLLWIIHLKLKSKIIPYEKPIQFFSPNEDALTKMLYIAYKEIAKKWTMPIRNRTFTFSQLSIRFDKRLMPFIKKWFYYLHKIFYSLEIQPVFFNNRRLLWEKLHFYFH